MGDALQDLLGLLDSPPHLHADVALLDRQVLSHECFTQRDWLLRPVRDSLQFLDKELIKLGYAVAFDRKMVL